MSASHGPSQTRPFLVVIAFLVLAVTLAGEVQRGATAVPADLTPRAYAPLISVPPAPPTSLTIQPYATGFNTDTITFIVNAGDERLFVGEKHGIIRIAQPNGNVLPTPFLDIVSLVRTSNWEEGLLGLAFHPNYLQNGYFFVLYAWDAPGSTTEDGQLRIVRYRVSGDPATSNTADPASADILIKINKPPDDRHSPPVSPVHNAGDLHFGPDGYLYIAIGDGGPDPIYGVDPVPGDPFNHGQRLDTMLGVIHRIDVDAAGPYPPDCGRSSAPYTIPADNPFRNGPNLPRQCDEIWAYGLRNPWRFSFDRLTGDMYIGDVGEWAFEEVDFQAAGTPGGANYGWHCYEGTLDQTGQPSTSGDCPPADYTFPAYQYDHSQGYSIIGGYVYRGRDYPGLWGQYLFADLSGTIWRMDQVNGQWETHVLPHNQLGRNWSTFGQDVDGELYLGKFGTDGGVNTIFKITAP